MVDFAFNAGAAGSIPGQEAKIPHASRPKNQYAKQKQYCNKFNKDFKKWSTLKEKNLRSLISLLSFLDEGPSFLSVKALVFTVCK